MIGIRADANRIIASGHVMRCITIAKEIVAQGENVTFLTADEESAQLIRQYAVDISDLDVVVLGSNWRDMEGELPVLEKELESRNISTLLVDSYQVTPGYFEKITGFCRVAYIDDLGKEAYPVDILVNYSGFYKELGYEKLYEGVQGHSAEPTKLLLGLDYAPLREQFYRSETEEPSESVREKKSILLTSGGADTMRMLGSVLEKAKENGLISAGTAASGPVWNVVAGSLVKDIDALEKFAAENSDVIIHRSVTNMAELMRKCDVAVCAAGTMLTECACIQLPCVFYQVADNQKFNVTFWQETGGMIFAGDVSASPQEKEKALLNITEILSDILGSDDKLLEMKGRLQGLTDGRGALRIAKALLT